MNKQIIDRSKLEKFVEDLWDRMRGNDQFEVLCNPDINEEYAEDRRTFCAMAMDEAKETFEIRNK